MSRKTIAWAAAAVALALPGALYWFLFAASPLPVPARLELAWPAAAPPGEMAVFRIPTGVIHRTAGFAYRGGSFRDSRDFAMTAVLVLHPMGDLLIDTGLGQQIDKQVLAMPWWFRALTDYTVETSAAEALDAAGYDPKQLRAILLTHAHWDHVSGVPDFPGTPVWLTADERRFIEDGDFVTVLARNMRDVVYDEVAFEGGPYLGFPRSHDVYGDGAIVIVPSPGHTPGSVIVFLSLPDGQRFALVGDLVWQLEGISERQEKPWLQSRAADADAAGVRENIVHMAALAEQFPQLTIVPAHDQRGFARMPLLPGAARGEGRRVE